MTELYDTKVGFPQLMLPQQAGALEGCLCCLLLGGSSHLCLPPTLPSTPEAPAWHIHLTRRERRHGWLMRGQGRFWRGIVPYSHVIAMGLHQGIKELSLNALFYLIFFQSHNSGYHLEVEISKIIKDYFILSQLNHNINTF